MGMMARVISQKGGKRQKNTKKRAAKPLFLKSSTYAQADHYINNMIIR